MRLLNLIVIAFLVISLAPAIANASDSNNTDIMAQDGNVSFVNQSTSRFHADRSSFETNLIKRIPAPQKYTDELPPAGAREVFYESGDLRLKAWLSDRPSDDNKHPAVVFAHGGFSFGGSGWEDGQEFINQGFVLMTPMLRGENGNPGNFEYFYGEVDDLVAAADYLANLSYVDSNRIFLCGHSVGGTLSILTSLMPSRYRAIASFGGMPNTEYLILHGRYPIPFDSKNKKEFELRSATYYPDSIITPLFLYVGDQGEKALKDYSESFANRERMNGKPIEFRAAKGDHWSSVPDSVRMCRVEFENIQAYESLALNRSRAYSLFLKGNDLFNLSRYDEAIKFYDEAIRLNPNYAEAWNSKGAAVKLLCLVALQNPMLPLPMPMSWSIWIGSPLQRQIEATDRQIKA